MVKPNPYSAFVGGYKAATWPDDTAPAAERAGAQAELHGSGFVLVDGVILSAKHSIGVLHERLTKQFRDDPFIGASCLSGRGLIEDRLPFIEYRISPEGDLLENIAALSDELNRANANIRVWATKFAKTTLEKPPATPHAVKKQTLDLSANLEQVIDAIVEKKLAERALARAGEIAQLPLAPAHKPGYEAAVEAGVDARTRIITSPEMVSSVELAKLMGVTRETVNQRRQKGTLLALAHGTRMQRYPTWQLEPEVVDAMPQLLESLRQLDAWTQYLFITQRNPGLDGKSPLEALRAGEIRRVLALAAEYADVMAPA